MWHVTHHTDICHSPLTTLDLGNDKNIIKTIGLKQFKAVTACQIKTLLAELNKCRTSPVHETLFAIVILNRFRKMNWLNRLEHFLFFSVRHLISMLSFTWVQIKRELDLEKSREISLLPLGVTGGSCEGEMLKCSEQAVANCNTSTAFPAVSAVHFSLRM